MGRKAYCLASLLITKVWTTRHSFDRKVKNRKNSIYVLYIKNNVYLCHLIVLESTVESNIKVSML